MYDANINKDEMNNKLIKYLELERQFSNLSIRKLASQCTFSHQTYRNAIKSKHKISIDMLIDVCNVYGISLSYLFEKIEQKYEVNTESYIELDVKR